MGHWAGHVESGLITRLEFGFLLSPILGFNPTTPFENVTGKVSSYYSAALAAEQQVGMLFGL